MSETPPSPVNGRNGTLTGIVRSVVVSLGREPMTLALMVLVVFVLWIVRAGVQERRQMDHMLMTTLLHSCGPKGTP